MEQGPAPGPHIELAAVSKAFGELWAVRALDAELRPGRLHALIGENGAGKSTALKLVAGLLAPSAGEIRIDGRPLRPATARTAIARGVGMVHQHFMLVEPFTVLENLVLGHEPTRPGGRLDLGAARARAAALAARVGLAVPLDRVTAELGVGERQRLEILRVLLRGARALLLDEPTAVLSPLEVGELYATLRRLAEGGATVVVVTHRLDEVMRHADTVTVMRRGRRVLDETLAACREAAARDGVDPTERLTRAVMGGAPPALAAAAPVAPDAAEALALCDLRVLGPDGSTAVDDLSLTLAAGEVVGVAGVEGNGQRELVRALSGLAPLAAGSVRLAGRALPTTGDRQPARQVRRRRHAELVVVHEDRHREELLPSATVADNLVLGDLGALDDEKATVARRFARFDIHPAGTAEPAAALSGGNQQKLVMARALDRPITALVLAQPTRGVDVGTAQAIRQAVSELASAGTAVLLVSADLAELRALAHRIVVMRRGRIVADLAPTASDETIGRAMLGLGEAPDGAEAA